MKMFSLCPNLNSFIIIFGSLFISSCQQEIDQYYLWDTIVLDFKGPNTSEIEEENPFLNYRLDVAFTHNDITYTVPGYYAADGQAAETGAISGKIWRVKFTPDRIGVWEYSVSFLKGNDIALASDPEGEGVLFDGKEGKFNVVEGDFSFRDFRTHGRLVTDRRSNFQKFQGSGKYYMKGGADSPENFLGYEDFDSTYNYEGGEFIHKYQPHVEDWRKGDPVWKGDKGKAIIGALNYLASKNMNSIYFLSMNIQGDGKDVWPYISHDEFLRFDVSKLDQWDIVFSHAQEIGILIQFVLQETENELLLDNGDTERQRKLYLRELIARFGHHNAMIWNIGEENGPADFSPDGQDTKQRKDMLDFIAETDPYDHLRVIHTHAASRYKDSILVDLLGFDNLDGLSLQVDDVTRIGEEIKKWKKLSADAGHPWVIYMDEIGPYWAGAVPDEYDLDHDTIRREALWGSLMSGGAGIEWYFGYKYPHADLNCEDWRSRENLWDQTKVALDFFQSHLPYEEMKPLNDIVTSGNALCLGKKGEVYALYISDLKPVIIYLGAYSGKQYEIVWVNPKTGKTIKADGRSEIFEKIEISPPPEENSLDWAVVINVK